MPALIGGFVKLFYPIIYWCTRIWHFPRLNNLSFWLLPPALMLLNDKYGNNQLEQVQVGLLYPPLSVGIISFSPSS